MQALSDAVRRLEALSSSAATTGDVSSLLDLLKGGALHRICDRALAEVEAGRENLAIGPPAVERKALDLAGIVNMAPRASYWIDISNARCTLDEHVIRHVPVDRLLCPYGFAMYNLYSNSLSTLLDVLSYQGIDFASNAAILQDIIANSTNPVTLQQLINHRTDVLKISREILPSRRFVDVSYPMKHIITPFTGTIPIVPMCVPGFPLAMKYRFGSVTLNLFSDNLRALIAVIIRHMKTLDREIAEDIVNTSMLLYAHLTLREEMEKEVKLLCNQG